MRTRCDRRATLPILIDPSLLRAVSSQNLIKIPHPPNTRLSTPPLSRTKASANSTLAQQREESVFMTAPLKIVTGGKGWLEQPPPLLRLALLRHTHSQRSSQRHRVLGIEVSIPVSCHIDMLHRATPPELLRQAMFRASRRLVTIPKLWQLLLRPPLLQPIRILPLFPHLPRGMSTEPGMSTRQKLFSLSLELR